MGEGLRHRLGLLRVVMCDAFVCMVAPSVISVFARTRGVFAINLVWLSAGGRGASSQGATCVVMGCILGIRPPHPVLVQWIGVSIAELSEASSSVWCGTN